MKLLIVIVNYRSAQLTLDCLDSLDAEMAALPDAQVVVTDNRSPDDSVTRLLAEGRGKLSPSPGTPGEGRGEGDFECKAALDIPNPPHPNPLPESRERGSERPWLTIMPLPENGGFAYGNNAAIAAALGLETLRRDKGLRPVLTASAIKDTSTPNPTSMGQRPGSQGANKPDFILLLNPDTIVRPGAIQALLDFMIANPKAGIAGSRLEDPDGTPQRSAFRFHSIAGELERGMRMGFVTKLLANKMIAPPQRDETYECDWVAGASMMVRREVFESAGLMDEKYFMYFEEVDFCLAAKRKGWSCWYVPASRVVHLVGAVSQLSDARKHRMRRPAYWFESRRRYFVKNHGWLYAALADLAYIAAHALWRLRRFVQRKEDTDPPKLLTDSVFHSVFFRNAE
jgi:GT2 family glycosyltransferase